MFRDGPGPGRLRRPRSAPPPRSTLTAGWTAPSAPPVTVPRHGEPRRRSASRGLRRGSGSLSAYPAAGGAPLWSFPVSRRSTPPPRLQQRGLRRRQQRDLYALERRDRRAALLVRHRSVHAVVPGGGQGTGRLRLTSTGHQPDARPGPGSPCTPPATRTAPHRPRPGFLDHTARRQPLLTRLRHGCRRRPVVVFGSVDPDRLGLRADASTGAEIWTYGPTTPPRTMTWRGPDHLRAPGERFRRRRRLHHRQEQGHLRLDLTMQRALAGRLAVGKAGDIASSALTATRSTPTRTPASTRSTPPPGRRSGRPCRRAF